MGYCSEIPPTTKAAHRPTPVCPPQLFNGILYVLTAGCTWHGVPKKDGTKSTIHRYHLGLCEKRVYQMIFLDLPRSDYEISSYEIQKIDYKKANGNKLSARVDRNGLPLACTVLPVNVHDSQMYEPTFEAFEIPRTDK